MIASLTESRDIARRIRLPSGGHIHKSNTARSLARSERAVLFQVLSAGVPC